MEKSSHALQVMSPHPDAFSPCSAEAVDVRVLPSRSEGLLPAGCGPEQEPADCGSQVTHHIILVQSNIRKETQNCLIHASILALNKPNPVLQK